MLSFVIAEEDLRIETSYAFNEVTAVFLLNNPREERISIQTLCKAANVCTHLSFCLMILYHIHDHWLVLVWVTVCSLLLAVQCLPSLIPH